MPLPPALAARLAKRGLLKSSTADNEPVEEVIAEDYDDRPALRLSLDSIPTAKAEKLAPAVIKPDGDKEEFDLVDETDELSYEVLLCPNRSNPFHECVEYCLQRWGCKHFKPDPLLTSRHERLLQRYPPPEGWLEVGDPETGRYYYWNVETDEVSWLPPQHPRAVISLSAEKRKVFAPMETVDKVDNDQWDSQGESEDEGSTDLDDENDEEQDLEKIERELKRKAQSERDRGKDHRRAGSRRVANESLDPMDPAAYSEVPRGGWTSGLEMRDTAKTGVDVTASGPLFQQRPYPSPGAVLRMNKKEDK